MASRRIGHRKQPVNSPAVRDTMEPLKIKVEATSYGQAMALEKLKSGQIAAMAFVTAKPAPLFAGEAPDSNPQAAIP